MNIYEKLLKVQTKLKAPKAQYNDFGKYTYRNAEDILEAVKPLCLEVGAIVVLTDEIVSINDRYYVKATARFIDTSPVNGTLSMIDVSSLAREEETKKGMDGSQITGASSSYARKYALNGLFAIDDTKDSDTTNTDNGTNKPTSKENKKVEQVAKKEDNKPFKTEEPKPLTLEEARQMGFTSNGKEYVVATMTDEQLLAMKDYTKLPRLAEACAMELAERAKARVKDENHD